MQEILNYLFLGEVLKEIEPKYLKEISPNKDMQFIYASFSTWPIYHNIFKKGDNNDYGTVQKFKDNLPNIIESLVKLQMTERENWQAVFLIYALISTTILNKKLEPLVNKLSERNKLDKKNILNQIEDQYLYIRCNKRVKDFNPRGEFKIKMDEKTENILDNVIAKNLCFQMVKRLYQKSLKEYVHLNKFLYFDPFLTQKLYLKAKKKSYLSPLKKRFKIDNNLELVYVIIDAKKETLEILNLINSWIYYNKIDERIKLKIMAKLKANPEI